MRAAQSSSAARRPGASTIPSGNWWAGAANAASGAQRARAGRRAGRRRRPGPAPSSRPFDGELRAARARSTGPRPRARVLPCATRARATSAIPWAMPELTTIAVGIPGHAAHAAQVAAERGAQLGRPARIAVVEAGRRAPRAGLGAATPARRRAGTATRRGAPGRKSKRGGRSARGRRRAPASGGGDLGHARGRSPAGHQVALGAELRVGVDHDAAGDAELGRERARGRQRHARRQAPRADRAAQLILELGAQGGRRRARARTQQVDRSGHTVEVVLFSRGELVLLIEPVRTIRSAREPAPCADPCSAIVALTLVGSLVAAADLVEGYPLARRAGDPLRARRRSLLLAIARGRLPRLHGARAGRAGRARRRPGSCSSTCS